MEFVQNFPFICIILSLFSGPLSSILNGKKAKWWNTFVITVIGVMNVCVLAFVVRTGEPYVYRMGHFSAPWGNEIRVGILEAVMAVFFCATMLLCMLGGIKEREEEIEESKQNLYYIMVNLLLSSLLALIYTNDLFTAYVFVEINTISACGLIMIRQNGRTIVAATRYMIMSLLGSGMLLLGICFLYSITGHLLISNIQQAVWNLHETGEYQVPLLVAVGLMCVGLAVKSALFPFHGWLPDAYGYSTVSSAAILSSLVSKGYIFLLLKIFYRVIGFEVIRDSKVIHVLFVFGIAGMIIGSIDAIRENSIRRMIAYSSVAQIGYIYMGFGLGTELGVLASVFHTICHAATKALLFLSASSLTEVSGDSTNFFDLTGAGYRDKVAGIGSRRIPFHGRFSDARRLYFQDFICTGGGRSRAKNAADADRTGHQYNLKYRLFSEDGDAYLHADASGRKERERLQNGGDEGAAGESGGPYLLCCPESGARPVLTADSDAVRARTFDVATGG